MSDLEIAEMLLMYLTLILILLQLYTSGSPKWSNTIVNDLDWPIAISFGLLGLVELALGHLLWGVIHIAMAVVSYYLYRMRGGGGTGETNDSIFASILPW